MSKKQTDKQKFREILKMMKLARLRMTFMRKEINRIAGIIFIWKIKDEIHNRSIDMLAEFPFLLDDLEEQDKLTNYITSRLKKRIAKSVIRQIKKEYHIK